MNLLKSKNFCLLVLIAVTFLTPTQDAQAGVLFRNRRYVVRITQPRFQTQNYKVIRSTAVMNSTSKGIFKSRSYGAVGDTMKLVRANLKYEQRLAKWEAKKLKQEEALEKKRRKIKQKEAKQREKEYARNRKNSGGFGKSFLASVTGGSGGQISAKPAARGALTNNLQANNLQSNKQTPAKKGFFASLWEALLGKRS